jgi:plastocyanin
MAQTAMIDIDALSGAPPGTPQAEFKPQNITVAVGDVIYWRNNDSKAHWPTTSATPIVNDAWMDYQIPGKLHGQPAPTSQQAVSFGTAGTYHYVCGLHHGETGTIVVQ